MYYILMDLEFNQPFDFEDGIKTPVIPECPFEIIQIGLVKMSEDFKIVDKKSLLAKPQLYKRMHPFVEKITSLSNKTFKGEKTFPEIYEEVLDFVGDKNNIFCIWGGSDIKLLYKNIKYYNLDHNTLTKKFINVQMLATQYLKIPGGASIGLKNAVDALNIPKEAVFHDALNDAVYTGEIFKIVKNDDMKIQIFNLNELDKSKEATRHPFNSKLLYKEIEKLYGRKLGRKEKEIMKKVYAMGRFKKFDTSD